MIKFEDVLRKAMQLKGEKTNPDATPVQVTDAQVMFEGLIELVNEELKPKDVKGDEKRGSVNDHHVTVGTYKKLVARVDKLEKELQ